jgi:hypothetical protein
VVLPGVVGHRLRPMSGAAGPTGAELVEHLKRSVPIP